MKGRFGARENGIHISSSKVRVFDFQYDEFFGFSSGILQDLIGVEVWVKYYFDQSRLFGVCTGCENLWVVLVVVEWAELCLKIGL